MTNSARRSRKSPTFQRSNSDESDTVEENDSDVSSESKSTRNSRRRSPKKLKRAATSVIKQSINWRCDPLKIRAIIKLLCPEQLKWIAELGFGSLTEMIDCKLPRKLTIWLMKKVDCDSKCLVFRNRKISIVDAVENLLKLPALDKEVPMPRPGRVRDKPFRGTSEFKSAKAGRGESLKEATDRMLTYKEEKYKDKFCICFMEVILCAYLAPTTGYQINRSYLQGALKDLSDIPRMNWCRFAADYLIEGIRDARENKVHNINVCGCVHILHLIYVDLLQSNLVTIPHGYPRIKYVGSEILNLIDHTGKKKTQDHCEMFEGLLDDEKLARFPRAEDHDDDINDTEKSTQSTPPVKAQLSTAPCKEKETLPPMVVQTSKKRRADHSTDENLIKRIKKLEDHYTAERDKLTTLFHRKLQNKLEQLEIQKTKEIAALVKEEIDKAMLPMIDDAPAASSEHNADPTLNKRSTGKENPSQSNLHEVVLLSAKSAQCVHQNSCHVDLNPQLTAGTPSSPTFMNDTVVHITHDSETATNVVINEGVEDDNFRSASSFEDQISQLQPSSSKQLPPSDHIAEAQPDACKDPLLDSICTFENLQSDTNAASATTALQREETSGANVVPASNISSVQLRPQLISPLIIAPSPLILTNNPGQQVQSHHVETLRNNMSSEDSSMMKIAGADVQADSASLLPVSTDINGPGHGNPRDQPDSKACAVEHAKQDSSNNYVHEVPNPVTRPENPDVIPDTAFIAPTSTEPASEIVLSDAHKITIKDTSSDNPAADVIQLAETEKTPVQDKIQNPSNEQLENLDVSKNAIQSKKDIETSDTDAPSKDVAVADTYATSKDVAIISSPPLSLEIVGAVSIMTVSQMTREYDQMNVPAAVTINSTQHTTASTILKVSTAEHTDNLIQPQPIVFETSVQRDHSDSILDVLHIHHSKLAASLPKPSNEPSPITLAIDETSPRESPAMDDSDLKELDQCVEMILGMNMEMPSNINEKQPTPAPANHNNESLSHAINEVLTENLEQIHAFQDLESSSCQTTQEEVANVAKIDITRQKEEESQDHPSDNSFEEVSSERTEDDDISNLVKEDSDSHNSYLTPRHSFRDIEIVAIADEPSSPKTIDCNHISKLAEPLAYGESFAYAGSINPSMKGRKQRYQKKEDIAEGISELVKKKGYPVKKLNDVYTALVANSKFKGLCLTRQRHENDTGGTKIRIGPSSVTEREFVQCLMPKGKMCKNMMWLLSVAMMYDWGSKTKVILDQTIIAELLKKTKKCDHALLCKKLTKLSLENVEQLYLPILSDNHWILSVINFTQNTIEIYDSNINVKQVEDPHKVILENMGYNLQKALNDCLKQTAFTFTDFPKKYCSAGKQTNNDDCGFWVIKVLLCHNGKELIGNYKWAMDVFRKELCYIPVYHRLNDLNPRRPEIQKIASSVLKTKD